MLVAGSLQFRHVGDMELQKGAQVARGVRHVLDVATPTLVFLLGYRTAGPWVGVALALAATMVIATVRIYRGDSLRMVRLSVLMVLMHSLSVTISGQGRDFFMPEILLNVGFALACGVSLMRGRPITALVARRFGMDAAGRPGPEHTKLTWMWLGLWCAHLAAMVPLYLTNKVAALGLVSTMFCKPSMVVLLFLSWRHLRAITKPAAPAAPAEPAGSTHSPAEK